MAVRISTTTYGPIVAEAGQANVNAEEQQSHVKVDRFRFSPTVKTGATYRF
jgi:hypothetical protein